MLVINFIVPGSVLILVLELGSSALTGMGRNALQETIPMFAVSSRQ